MGEISAEEASVMGANPLRRLEFVNGFLGFDAFLAVGCHELAFFTFFSLYFS